MLNSIPRSLFVAGRIVKAVLEVNLLVCLFISLPLTSFADVLGHGKKKIIEWGLDMPTTGFIRENIEKVENMPFDGIVFPVIAKDGANLGLKMWSAEKIEFDSLKYMVDDLNQTPFVHLTDNFINVGVTPGGVDWFDDDSWNTVLSNFAVAARIAKDGNCKGFMFDLEQYIDSPFSLAWSDEKHAATRGEYRKKLNQRGAELVKTISSIFPDMIIIFPYTYHIAEIVKPEYELLPDFLDGIFSAAPKSMRLIDGWEGAYLYKSLRKFQIAYGTIKEHLPMLSRAPEAFRERIEVGFGIRVDGDAERRGWHPDDYSKNYFSPEEFGEVSWLRRPG